MYAPGVLWTAARHKIPLLAVMHNNRGYHQEVMHVQRMSNFRNRVVNTGKDMGPVGTSIQNPDIDYRKLAESMGWWAKGPIKNPSELGPALKEAVAMAHVREARLLAVPWLRRPGQRRRFEDCAESAALRGVLRLRAHHRRRDAALSKGDPVGRRPRRHLRLSAVGAEGAGPEDDPTAQSVGAKRFRYSRGGIFRI